MLGFISFQGCDFIVALTHMRVPNDIKLAENVPEIDLILGGHDHHYEIIQVNRQPNNCKTTLSWKFSGVFEV